MVNSCVNCGNSLLYDIESGMLKCDSCDSQFDPEQYKWDTKAISNEAAEDYEVTVFACPNCGARISSTELEAVEYCLYCGSFVTLSGHLENVEMPQGIIPFEKTKEDCQKAYTKMIRKRIYAPAEFRKAEFLEGFKGIYIPYWTYDYSYGPHVTFKGKEEYRKGDYKYTQEYDINCDAEGSVDCICFDASSALDDHISSHIVPFEADKMKPFNPSYMFGFFADTADIDQDLYISDADELAQNEIWEGIEASTELKEGHPEKPQSGAFERNFNVKKKSSLAMLPVWFLTWRKNDRIAYSVMNGATGNLYAEIPVDIKRYLAISLITAVPLYFLLNCIITFSAHNMLMLAMVLSFVMMMLYTAELDEITGRQFHVNDKGYLSKHEKKAEEAKDVTENWVTALVGELWDIAKTFSFWEWIIGFVGIFFVLQYVLIGFVILVVVVPLYSMYRIYKNAKLLYDQSVWMDVAFILLPMVISAIMLFRDPAGDIYYYVMAIICMAGIGMTAILMMRRYNDLITREVPHFFNRQAGGKS